MEAIIKQNKNLQQVETLNGLDGLTFLVSEHRFENYTVQVVKSQWTRTQKIYCIRILNFYTGNRPHIQIPYDTLRDCNASIREAERTGVIHLWTGHSANVGRPLNNAKQ